MSSNPNLQGFKNLVGFTTYEAATKRTFAVGAPAVRYIPSLRYGDIATIGAIGKVSC
jgi:hypothetical protein